MSEKTLHITNGSILTGILKELDYSGDILTWEEMLCEGPTMSTINSDTFLKKRASNVFCPTFAIIMLPKLCGKVHQSREVICNRQKAEINSFFIKGAMLQIT